ncbi:MAG: cupin domain-containing protein [Chloroflexi bacterium]|nr:cupin domain-containing protein [Chloroflexota bacterium]
MRWSVIGVVVTALILTGLAKPGGSPPVRAQGGTPVASPVAGPLPGVTGGTLASSTLEVLTPGTAFLSLGRSILAPGAVVPFDPTDPTADLVYVTAGELTVRVEPPVTVARQVGQGTPAPPPTVMRTGDAALFPAFTRGEIRNDGTTAAIVLAANLAVVSTAATPTP